MRSPDPFSGSFTRMSPATFAESIGIPLGWFVIDWRWMPDKKQRRRNHGKVFQIQSGHGTVYRVLRFSTKLKGSPTSGEGKMVIDWPGWLELSGFAEDVDGPLNLTVSRVAPWNRFMLIFSHPDPNYQLAGVLGLVSAFLGILSLVMALL